MSEWCKEKELSQTGHYKERVKYIAAAFKGMKLTQNGNAVKETCVMLGKLKRRRKCPKSD